VKATFVLHGYALAAAAAGGAAADAKLVEHWKARWALLTGALRPGLSGRKWFRSTRTRGAGTTAVGRKKERSGEPRATGQTHVSEGSGRAGDGRQPRDRPRDRAALAREGAKVTFVYHSNADAANCALSGGRGRPAGIAKGVQADVADPTAAEAVVGGVLAETRAARYPGEQRRVIRDKLFLKMEAERLERGHSTRT
jgi:hypothetical protein